MSTRRTHHVFQLYLPKLWTFLSPKSQKSIDDRCNSIKITNSYHPTWLDKKFKEGDKLRYISYMSALSLLSTTLIKNHNAKKCHTDSESLCLK